MGLSHAERMARANARINRALGGPTVATVRAVDVNGVFMTEAIEATSGDHVVLTRRTVFACQIADLPADVGKGDTVTVNDEIYSLREFDPPGGDDGGNVRLVLAR